MTPAEAGEIVRNPQLRATWEQLTGKKLPTESVNKARQMILNTHADALQSQPQNTANGIDNVIELLTGEKATTEAQNSVDTSGDITTPPNVPNDATASPVELNSAVNDNARKVGANYPVETATGSLTQQNIDNNSNAGYNDIINTRGDVNAQSGDRLYSTAGDEVRADSRATDTESQRSDWNVGQGDLRVSGVVLLSDRAKSTLNGRGVVVMEAYDASNSKAAFCSALDDARNSDVKNGWAVTPKTVESLNENGAKPFMTENGTAGFAVTPDGDIEAVFANKEKGAPAGVTKSLLPQAIANGGTKLDCYGSGLATLYTRYGFIPVARVSFNSESANPGWNPSKGTPDVIFMMHNGDSADAVVDNYENYHIYTKEEFDTLPLFTGKDGYDNATKYRDSLLAQRSQSGNSGTEQKVKSNLGTKSPDARTSQTVETLLDSDIISDERAEQLNPYVEKGRFDYIPDTNEAQVDRATKKIAKVGWEQSVKDFHDEVVKGKSGKDLMAEGAVLLNNAANSDASAKAYLDLANDYIELAHRAGEALQAAKIVQQLTPEGRLYLLSKNVDSINKNLTESQRNKIAKKKGGNNLVSIVAKLRSGSVAPQFCYIQ